MIKSICKVGRVFITAAVMSFVLGSLPGFAALPADYKEFKARYATEAKTLEGAVKLHLDAIFCYMNPQTREEGSKMLRYSLRLKQGWENNPNYRTFVERLKDKSYSHIFRSYAEGTSPQNDYKMSPDNYKIMPLRKSEYAPGIQQLTIRSSGADNPRPIQLMCYDDLWFISGNAAVYVGIRPPQSKTINNDHDADFD